MSNHHEDAEQAAVFDWAAYHQELWWMHAIPNGAFLAGDSTARAIQMKRLKRQGLKTGVSDIFLPLPRGGYHGLYIEMKRRKDQGSSSVSDEQVQFQKAMIEAGYDCRICYGADEAIGAIKEYAGI